MKSILFVLAISLLIALTSTASAFNNPFNLITDEKLESAGDGIDDLWKAGEGGSFAGVDNKKIAYMIFRHPKEIGAIVISSGRTETYIKYKELIYNLNKARYTVYIHDHRGQGFSERMAEDTQKGHVWDFDDYVTDLKTFFDLKVAPEKHHNVYLLAHSMGGGIATIYIEKHQEDFKAAALSSPMHQPDTGILGGAACTGASFTTSIRDIFISMFGWEPRYALGQGPYEKKEFTPNNKDIMTHSKSRYLAIQELYDKHDQVKIGGITSHWLANACEASSKLLKNAGTIKIPVLVLQAEEDIAVTAKGQNEFCHILSTSGKSTCKSGKPIVIHGAYHEMFIESDAYRIPAITEILRFFREHSS